MVRPTDILCPNCSEANLEVVEGWETHEALKCPKCGDYHYFVGNVYCAYHASAIGDAGLRQRLKEALGGDKGDFSYTGPRIADRFSFWPGKEGDEKDSA